MKSHLNRSNTINLLISLVFLSLLGCVQLNAAEDQSQQTPVFIADSIETVSIITGQSNLKSVDMGANSISSAQVKSIPSILGEMDVMKFVQYLPGVKPSSEASSGFSVRGGAIDQNLILLDGSTIYNPSHMLGFFSVFNNDVVESADLYKGNMPAKYGGRLSALLSVKTRKKADKNFGGTAGIGLISSRLMLEGDNGGQTYWSVGGRRSYADLFLKLSPDKSMRTNKLYFYDLNARVVQKVSKKDYIGINGYYGRDKMGLEQFSFGYGNLAGGISWEHRATERFHTEVSVGISNYNYRIETDYFSDRINWKSSIGSPYLNLDFMSILSNSNVLRWGARGIYHDLNIGTIKYFKGMMLDMARYDAIEATVYVSDEHTFANGIALNGSLRFNVFSNYKAGAQTTYNTMDVRVGGVFPLSVKSSIKANYGRNSQFLLWANNSSSGSPLNVWITAGENIKPQLSDQFALGYFRNFSDSRYEFSVEAYYKKVYNLIDFAENTSLLLNRNLEADVRAGEGENYGVEFNLSKTKGRLTGFVNYTLSHSQMTIADINQGKTYLSPYDRPHVINASAGYRFSPKWSVSLLWVYSTGSPASFPTHRISIGGETDVPIYEGRNTYRIDDYHRMDVSATYSPIRRPNRRVHGEWNFSIYNLYGRKNIWMISFSPSNTEKNYLFSIVPSFSYNIKF